jgi:hypothetical protein
MASLGSPTPRVTRRADLAVTFRTPLYALSVTNSAGLFVAGATPDQAEPLLHQTAPATSGSLTFSTAALPLGDYDMWYLYDGSIAPLAAPLRITVTP